MISLIGHSPTKNGHYLLIRQALPGESRRKTPLQKIAKYFGI